MAAGKPASRALSIRTVECLVLLFCLLSLPGCASTVAITKATEDRENGGKDNKNAGPIHAQYFALLPVTVPFDVATFPLQCMLLPLMLKGLH